MSPLTLTLEITCTREEAARFAAVELFLAAYAEDPAAVPAAELEAVFGPDARAAILALVGSPVHLGITCRFDRSTGVLTLLAADGRPNLAALPMLLLWLYPDKLPLAYSVHVTDRPALVVWTIVALRHIEITQHGKEVAARLEALRAQPGALRRLDLPFA